MKRVICIVLAVLMAAALCSCGQQNEGRLSQLDKGKVKMVSGMDSLYSSYFYIIEDEGAVAELTDLYNSVRFEPVPEEEQPKDILMDTIPLQYHYEPANNGIISDAVASLWISPRGYVLLENGDDMIAYKLTSSFDADRVKAILDEYGRGGDDKLPDDDSLTDSEFTFETQ